MERKRLELDDVSRSGVTGLAKHAEVGGAKSGALGADTESLDPRLLDLTERWPHLSEAVKAGIIAMVRACDGQE